MSGPKPEISTSSPVPRTNTVFNLESFRTENLERHNNYRTLHQVPPLTYSKELNDYAQSYANKIAAVEKLEHSGGKYGENLWKGVGMKINGNLPCDRWYSESEGYDYSKDNPHFKHLHFTQVIWKTSTQTGIGISINSKSGNIYVVAVYEPRGNWKNNYLENVLPPKST